MEMCCTKAGELGQLSKRIAGQKYNLVTKHVWPKVFLRKIHTFNRYSERAREEMPTSSYNYDGISILQGAL